MNNDMPCRVTADLNAYESERFYSDAFNEYDSMHVGAVVPYELVKPVQALLEIRNGLVEGDPLKEYIDQLYRACVERWRDI